MSDKDPSPLTPPPCPMCAQATYLKQTHRGHVHELRLLVFKCLELRRRISGGGSRAGLRNPASPRGVIPQMTNTRKEFAMTDDDNDIGPIVVAVVLGTLVAGAFLYGWNRYDTVQTALNIPSIERTIPTIVPNQPQF